MKHVYLVQPSNILSNEVFLPYAAGALASYAWQFEDVKSEWVLKGIVFKKDPLAEVLVWMEEPRFVGFSCYMWNVEYNLRLAEEVKKTWPECLIVFGGPEIPANTVYLEEHDFIDILLFGEGERSFYGVLTAGRDFDGVPNIAYRSHGKIIRGPKKTFRDISDFPSPYASGVFDDIISDPRYAALRFDAVLETNRGCPYGCIYCYWAGTEKNFRLFSMDRVRQDLEWIAKNRIVYCICADSNFGILERDREITDYLINLKKQYGFPLKFETSSAKNKDEAVFAINRKLQKAGMNCGISVAVQSFSPTVLRNIGRTNLSVEHFAAQLKQYREAGMATYTDLILALPGETFESFCQGVFCAIESGQHDSINVHPCEVLPNTILALPETREKFHIETVCSVHYQDHALIADGERFGSRSEIIVATDTMTRSEWRDAMRLSVCVQSFHSFGLLKCFALYLRRVQDVSYSDFYMGLYAWIQTEGGPIREILDHVCATIDSFLKGKSSLYYKDSRFSNAYLQFKEGVFLCSVMGLDAFYAAAASYLQRYFDDADLFRDLLCYQKTLIKTPDIPREEVAFSYDWERFFAASDTAAPTRRRTVLVFEACAESDWPTYTRNNIWYGKRENKMLRKIVRSAS